MRIQRQNQFKRDVKRLKKQNKDFAKLKNILASLIIGKPLEKKYKDHPLSGKWKGCRECHIEPDWLLIYKPEPETLWLVRTGSHSELFG